MIAEAPAAAAPTKDAASGTMGAVWAIGEMMLLLNRIQRTRRRCGVISALLVAGLLMACAPAAWASVISVDGKQLVNGQGHVIRLLGANRAGTEYACADGWGFFDSPHPNRADDARIIDAMRSWRINAVRIPLNEACWLGINGVAARYAKDNYRRAIDTEVRHLENAHIVPILDLHEVVPRHFTVNPDVWGLRPMPDAGHAVPFWRSVAKRYGHDRSTVFDLYNEPNTVSWRCLRDGCLITRDAFDSSVPNYRAVGMQRLVDVIRRQGAQNVIMAAGLGGAADLGHWLQWRPNDPLHRLAASYHSYEDASCQVACWNNTLAPIAKRFPIITGEMGDVDCNHDYINAYMNWADRHGVSYLGWTWNASVFSDWDCSRGPSLIQAYSGRPTGYGVGLREHLRALRPG
jgi:endoglucanase